MNKRWKKINMRIILYEIKKKIIYSNIHLKEIHI